MKKINLITVFSFLALLAVLFSCNGGSQKKEEKKPKIELSGAGATFPLPFYNMIFENYNNKKVAQVAYGGIGSGGGIRNLKDGIVDFAGSDAFVSDKEMEKMKEVIHIPTCMGAVVVAYNLAGVNNLVLSGNVIADIFAGKINRWNDKQIKKLNPEIELPDSEIIPVYRSDGSGTTAVFTDYLCKVSPSWAERFGEGKSVNFPTGQAAKGNPGVAGIISQTANSIGYIGSEYAFAQHIPYASVLNAKGEIVKPTAASISVAASGEIPVDTRTMITDSQVSGAYPISCFTWIVVYKEQNYSNRSKSQAQGTVDFLKYVLSKEAQDMASQVHYSPLPQKIIDLSKENLKKITYNNMPLKVE